MLLLLVVFVSWSLVSIGYCLLNFDVWLIVVVGAYVRLWVTVYLMVGILLFTELLVILDGVIALFSIIICMFC